MRSQHKESVCLSVLQFVRPPAEARGVCLLDLVTHEGYYFAFRKPDGLSDF